MKQGRVIEGRFECGEKLQRPEPGDSFLGHDKTAGQDVIVRILPVSVSNEGQENRFLGRVEELVRLTSKNVEKVLDGGLIDGGTPYVVTEKPKGRFLDSVIAEEAPFSIMRTIEICRQITRGLADAARNKTVHGRLSPRLVQISAGKNGRGAEKVKIVGFAPFDLEESVNVFDFDVVAPEVILGASPDTRSDCYALGVIMYSMLTGKRPFTAESREALTLAHLNDRIDVPSTVRKDEQIPPALDNLVLRLLEKNPDKRLGNPEQVLVHLENIYSNEQESAVYVGDSDVNDLVTPEVAAASAVPDVESDLDEGISFASGRRVKTTDFSTARITERMGSLNPSVQADGRAFSRESSRSTQPVGVIEQVSVVTESSEPERQAPAPDTARRKAGPSPLAVVALAGIFLLAAIAATGWFVLRYQENQMKAAHAGEVTPAGTLAPARSATVTGSPAPAEPAAAPDEARADARPYAGSEKSVEPQDQPPAATAAAAPIQASPEKPAVDDSRPAVEPETAKIVKEQPEPEPVTEKPEKSVKAARTTAAKTDKPDVKSKPAEKKARKTATTSPKTAAKKQATRKAPEKKAPEKKATGKKAAPALDWNDGLQIEKPSKKTGKATKKDEPVLNWDE